MTGGSRAGRAATSPPAASAQASAERPDGVDRAATNPAGDAGGPVSERPRPTLFDPLRATHPRQALLSAAVVALAASLLGRPVREVLVAAAAVLLVQASLGLHNDVCDVAIDRRSGVPGKPIAQGAVGRSDALWLMLVLLFAAVPLSLQNGTVAGIALLATLPVGWIHNRWLHRGRLSWLGWAVTFALLPAFLAYGGWGAGMHGSPPTITVTVLAAALGVCVHVLTSLPDLVADNRAGLRTFPVRIGLRIGAPRLLAAAVPLTAIVAAALVLCAVSLGLSR